MSREQSLRDQAARYLALALQARQSGDVPFAEKLTTRASDLLEEADRLRHIMSSPPPEPQQPGAQQQQQVQPKKEE
jgi:hypothetical protein